MQHWWWAARGVRFPAASSVSPAAGVICGVAISMSILSFVNECVRFVADRVFCAGPSVVEFQSLNSVGNSFRVSVLVSIRQRNYHEHKYNMAATCVANVIRCWI